MKAYIQNHIGYTASNDVTQNYAIYYMTGSVPNTIEDVKATVDLSDISDIHSKCVGMTVTLGTVTSVTTGIGSYYITHTLVDEKLGWLKGGYMPPLSPSVPYYTLPPDRLYREDGLKNTMFSLPPPCFSLPAYAASAGTYGSPSVAVSLGNKLTATSSYPTAGATQRFVYEYDNATTVSILRCGALGGISSSQSYFKTLLVDYWDGGSWVNCGTYTVSYSSAAYTLAFTAVTANRFRVTVGLYNAAAGTTMMAMGGIALMHTSPPATVSVPDITWGILIPFCEQSTGAGWYVYHAETFSADLSTYNATSNPTTGRSTPYYGVASKNIPAIIDTCGQDSTSNKMVISKSKLLDSTDHPTLASYRYYPGDLVL